MTIDSSFLRIQYHRKRDLSFWRDWDSRQFHHHHVTIASFTGCAFPVAAGWNPKLHYQLSRRLRHSPHEDNIFSNEKLYES